MHRIRQTGFAAAAGLCGFLVLLGSGCTSSSAPGLSRNEKAEAMARFSMGLLAEANGDSTNALHHLQAAAELDPSGELPTLPAIGIALKNNRPELARRLAATLTARSADPIKARLLQARVYALTEQPEQAETLFKQVYADHPEHAEAALALSRFYLSQKRKEPAAGILQKALAEHGTHSDLLHLLGTLRMQPKQDGSEPAGEELDAAADLLRRSLDADPDHPDRWQQLGLVLRAADDPAGALDAFGRAVELSPGDLSANRQLFDLLIESGRLEECLDMYDRMAVQTGTEPAAWLQHLAEHMPPEQYGLLIDHLEHRIQAPAPPMYIYAQLSSLYIDTDDTAAAEDVLTQALDLYPDAYNLRSVLGYLYLQSEAYDAAYTELNTIRQDAPEKEWTANPFFLYHFLISAQKSGHSEQAADLLAATADHSPVVLKQYMQSLLSGESPVSIDGAIQLLKAFHTRSPQTAEALYYLMMLQADRKEYAEALETARRFKTAAQQDGSTNLLSGEFYYQYAALHERAGRLDEAEPLFYRAMETGTEGTAAAARNYVAYMWAERGEKLDTGLELIREALAVDPDNGAFLDTLGWIYYMQGRYPEALETLRRAREQIDDDPVIWEHLGDTHLKLGHREKAIAHWNRALELDPDSGRLLERLKEAGVSPDEAPAKADAPEETTPRP